MITPAGKRKLQVNQGHTKHKTILESDIFEKIAISKLPGHMPDTEPTPTDSDVGEAMSRGGLDLGRYEDKPDIDLGPTGNNAKSISPNGVPRNNGSSPADKFLGPAPANPQDSLEDPYEDARRRIRDFVGYSNFGVDLSPAKDGGLDVTLTPPQGVPVDVGGLLEALRKHLGGQWGGESTPSQTTGGPIKFKYIPQNMAQDRVQQTVQKKGPPLGAPIGGKGQVTRRV